MRAKKLNGFSLMEMMIVLLIVAIVAAASAPLVSKKMSRSAGTNDSPWVFTGMNGNIAYNMGGDNNDTVIIGAAKLPASLNGHTRLFIDSDDNGSHITFGNGEAEPMELTADPDNKRVGFTNQVLPQHSVALGGNQSITANSGIVSIGCNTINEGNDTVAVGNGARARNSQAIAMGYNPIASGQQSIAIGGGADDTTNATNTDCIAIGSEAKATNRSSIAMGYRSNASGLQSIAIGGSATSPTNAIGSNDIAIGSEANASNTFSVAVGPLSKASGSASVALGFHSEATELSATALGDDTHATHYNSTAIGVGAKTTAKNQIVLGRTSETVYIPGNLVVGGSSAIGINGNSHVFLNVSDGQAGDSIGIVQVCSNNDYLKAQDKEKTADGVGATYSQAISWFSDRRLKNVGEKYTAGLAELKKLDFFHYTFKKDEEKTPHVGVIAQDLQKVFPDAVTKGEDGYLRIRFEDMFYAVINAVKELDNKISEIVQNITDINSTIEKQNKTIEEQQKTINELLKRVEKLEKAG